MLGESLLVPTYIAVIEWVLTPSALVEKVATPAAFTVAVLRVAAPSLKTRLPVGVGPLAAVTVAVKVTAVPCVDGLSEETSVVAVAERFTVCVRAAEVLVRYPELPE